MRISELSKQSDTSISTIKFYIREGLLPPGQATARNQAIYGERHVERLDLIQRLKDYADLSIETIGAVLNAAGAKSDDYEAMGAGLDATSRPSDDLTEKLTVQVGATPGQEMVAALAKSRGWSLSPDDSSLDDIALALDRILEGWPFDLPENVLENYTDLALEMASLEIPDDWHEGLDEDGVLKFALLGTFLFEPLILAIRRSAHRVRILESMK